MFEGHDPYLVALSLLVAILGGYTGFDLAARVRETTDSSHRLLLAGAAAFLAISIWTMHFVGMLAAPIASHAAYLVLPTIISFLICALVVGISLFFVSVGDPSLPRVLSSACLLGTGIATMHYVGMHGLAGDFAMRHDAVYIVSSVLIAVGAAYVGLSVFIARQDGIRLIASAVVFGIAVSGMHYTAMAGTQFVPKSEAAAHLHVGQTGGLVASQQVLSVIVTLLCFIITAGFLLSLVPDRRRQTAKLSADDIEHAASVTGKGTNNSLAAAAPSAKPVNAQAVPTGFGRPATKTADRLPVEAADGTHFINIAEVRSIRADAHYTLVHDGTRERMCPWSISEAEAQLDPTQFMRVHRSHLVAMSHVTLVRREGDGAVVELDGPSPHLAPVSRAKTAELRARLGLIKRTA